MIFKKTVSNIWIQFNCPTWKKKQPMIILFDSTCICMYKVYFIKYYQYFSNLYFEQLLFFRNFILYIAVYFFFFEREKHLSVCNYFALWCGWNAGVISLYRRLIWSSVKPKLPIKVEHSVRPCWRIWLQASICLWNWRIT